MTVGDLILGKGCRAMILGKRALVVIEISLLR